MTNILDPAEGVRTPPTIPPVTLEDGTTFTIARIDKKTARDMIVANHYSGTWNAGFGVYSFGLFAGSDLVGALAYGNPMNPGSVTTLADLPPDSVTELNRMWISDTLGPNTETASLARTMRWLKNNAGIQLVQTFADGRLGCGTVYKAANFGYYGYSETLFFRSASDGGVLHGTPLTNTGDSGWGAFPRSMIAKNLRLISGDLEAFTAKTYRYLYPLTRYARRRVLLKQQPYPAYDKGETTLPNYTPPASQIARCFVACTIAGYADQAAKFAAYMSANYPAPDVAESVRQAERNEWLVALADATQPDLFGGVA